MRLPVVLLGLALAGCATQPLATVSAPISGSVTFGAPSRTELVPVVRTVILDCEPPSQFLSRYPPLPPLLGERMAQQQAFDQWASDMAAYDDMRADHDGLIGWVQSHCQAQRAPP